MITRNMGPAVAALLFGLAGVLVILSENVGAISTRIGFMALTIVLLLYLWSQVMRVRRVHPERWLLNPVVLCSFMTFFMAFGLGNVLYFLPAEALDSVEIPLDISPAMLKLMGLVLLGAIGMWMGYWSTLAASLSNATQQKKASRLLRKSDQLQSWAIPALLTMSVVSRLIAIKLGLFGYSSNYERLTEMGGVTQYLSLFSSLGQLALVVAALEYYSDKSSIRAKTFFVVVLFSEVSFGLLSGFKSPVVMPFLIVGICQYLRTGSLPKKWMLVAFFAIFVAYQVIEPFRDLKNSTTSFKGTSVAEISGVMIDAQNENKRPGHDEGGTLIDFLARSSLAYVGSLGIEFADNTPTLPEGSPEFLKNILLAPVYAWVPRLIWSGKPLGDLGLWYNQVVIGNQYSFSSTAMSPFTYLYLAGGIFAVFIGFFFIGIVQRLLFFLMRPYLYMSGAVIYMGMLASVVSVADGFDSLIISLVRELPLLIVVQRLIYRRQDSRANRSRPSGRSVEDRPLAIHHASGAGECAD